MAVSMLHGERDRRWLTAMIALALIAEGVAVIVCGPNAKGGTRAAGSFGQPNELGAYLAMSTTFCAAAFMGVKSWFGRAGLGLAVLLGVYAIFLCLSRGAMAAVAVGLAFVALRSSKWMAIPMLLVLVTSPLWAPQSVKDRIAESQVSVDGSDEVEVTRSGRTRLGAWKIALDSAQDHILDGLGYGALHLVLQDAVAQGEDEVAGSAHNTYLRMLAEMGIFGLAAFLFLLWQCFSLAMRGIRQATNKMDRQIAVGMLGTTLALCVTCGFGDRFHEIKTMGAFWLVAAMVQDFVFEKREPAA
jgi:putative inorganic carbon (HCO3(-)) transporter